MPCFYKQLKIDPNTRFYFTNHTLHLCIKIQALRTVLLNEIKVANAYLSQCLGLLHIKIKS